MKAEKHENKLANQIKQKEPSQNPTWNYIKSLSNWTLCVLSMYGACVYIHTYTTFPDPKGGKKSLSLRKAHKGI